MHNKLKIAVGNFSPLVIKDNGQYSGFEIELWEAVAKEAGIEEFEYTQLPFPEIISSVSEKKYDIGLSGITINSKREEVIDFSHPTLDSGLLILVNKSKKGFKMVQTIKFFFSEGYKMLISPLIFALVFIILFGNLLWFAEQNVNTFSPTYFPGIFEAFWLIISTMSTDSFGDYIPHTWLGRIITTFAIVGGVAVFGLLVAKVTAFLTIKKIQGEINNYHDLTNKTVATVKNSTSVSALRKIGARVVEVPMIEEAYTKLSKEEVDAVVFDAPVIAYLIEKKNPESKHFAAIGDLFEKQKYAIVLQAGSSLREKINQGILRIRESGIYDSIYRKWFGDDVSMEA